MNSTQLQCFIAAAEQLSFTAAAEALYISQPAMSRKISALEEELDVILFERRNNVLRLTEGGKILYRWAKDSAASLERAVREAARANASGYNELVLGFVRNEILSERDSRTIALFQRSHPEVELKMLHFNAPEIIRSLTEQQMDLAIMIGSAAYGNPRLRYLESARFHRCAFVSQTHPLAERGRLSLKELAGELFLSIRGEVSPTMSPMIRDACGEAGFVPRLLELDSIDELLSKLESGKGVALLVDNHVARFNPLLKMLPLKEELPVSLICVWDRLNPNPNIREYLEIFRSLGPAGE